jgi:hypothetical protein
LAAFAKPSYPVSHQQDLLRLQDARIKLAKIHGIITAENIKIKSLIAILDKLFHTYVGLWKQSRAKISC